MTDQIKQKKAMYIFMTSITLKVLLPVHSVFKMALINFAD